MTKTTMQLIRRANKSKPRKSCYIKRNIPMADLALKGRRRAQELSKVNPALLHDLTNPVIVISEQMRDDIRLLTAGKDN